MRSPSSPSRVLSASWPTLLVSVSTLTPLTPAHAAGFEVPDNGTRAVGRGGAVAASSEDLTAAHFNPALLARQSSSLSLLYNHNLVFHESTFTRAPLSEGWGARGAQADTSEVSDRETLFPLGVFVAGGTNFGLEDAMFAASIYGPHSNGKQNWPDYGPQSFMLTETDMILVYYSASAAWSNGDRFGIGVTLQYVDMPKLEYELVMDARVDPEVDPMPDRARAGVVSSQTASKLDLEDRFAYTAIVGAFVKITDHLELAAGGRVLPVKLDAKGGIHIDNEALNPQGLKVEMPLTLPRTARVGLRYVDPGFDVELDFVWENWSVIDKYHADMDGTIQGQPVNDLVIEKQWQDSMGVRLGGDVALVPGKLDVRAGGFVESGAAPKYYSHIDFPSFDRLGLSGGLTFHLDTVGVPGLALSAAYSHVFQEDREVTEAYGKAFQQRPKAPCPEGCDGLSGVVANAGRFETSFDIVSVGLDYRR